MSCQTRKVTLSASLVVDLKKIPLEMSATTMNEDAEISAFSSRVYVHAVIASIFHQSISSTRHHLTVYFPAISLKLLIFYWESKWVEVQFEIEEVIWGKFGDEQGFLWWFIEMEMKVDDTYW